MNRRNWMGMDFCCRQHHLHHKINAFIRMPLLFLFDTWYERSSALAHCTDACNSKYCCFPPLRSHTAFATIQTLMFLVLVVWKAIPSPSSVCLLLWHGSKRTIIQQRPTSSFGQEGFQSFCCRRIGSFRAGAHFAKRS